MIIKGDSEDISKLWGKCVTWFEITETIYEHSGILGCCSCGRTFSIMEGFPIVYCCDKPMRFINIPDVEFWKMFCKNEG